MSKKRRARKMIIRLRTRNNFDWDIVWAEGRKTTKGLKAWNRIKETDLEINRWMRRI
jgi:hypothetical protein